MDGPTFVNSFEDTRPITFADKIGDGEVRLSVIHECTVTRVAIKDRQIPKVEAFANVLGAQVCWSKDLISVVLPPAR